MIQKKINWVNWRGKIRVGIKRDGLYIANQGFVLLNFYCNKNAIIATFAIIAINQLKYCIFSIEFEKKVQ